MAILLEACEHHIKLSPIKAPSKLNCLALRSTDEKAVGENKDSNGGHVCRTNEKPLGSLMDLTLAPSASSTGTADLSMKIRHQVSRMSSIHRVFAISTLPCS